MRNTVILLACLACIWSCKNDSEVHSISDWSSLQDVLKIPDSLSYVFQNELFHEHAMLKEIRSGEELRLENINFENKVIAYLSDVQCTSCVDQEVEFLKQFYNDENLILLCNYPSERDLKLYLKIHRVDIPVYAIITSPSELLMRLPFPTYFKLNSNYKPTSVFFASVSTPNRSRSYHQLMAELVKK